MAEETDSISVIAVTAAVGAVMLLLMLVCGIGRKSGSQQEEEEETKQPQKNGPGRQNSNQQQSKKQRPAARSKKETKHTFSHPWLAGCLKGHSGPVTSFDFSPNSKYLVSVAEDRSVLLWTMKDFQKSEHKSVRGNVEFDHATRVKFSPDSKAFITSLGIDNTVRIFRFGKKEDGTVGNIQGTFDFPKKHKADIINIGIASNGRFIMTCSSDTTIIVWDIKGEILGTIDTHQMNNFYASVSPCGRFVASSGFTSDVKVWEVEFDKGGNFKEISRAFELKGHTAGVYSFSFNSDSSRMASVSKDGTWKLWDTFVEYKKQQDPHLLCTGSYSNNGPSLIALSPDSRVIAIATGPNISVYNTQSKELTQALQDVYAGNTRELQFESSGKYFASAGDKQVHVFHNVDGYRATIADLEQKLKSTGNTSAKHRMQQQITDAQAALNEILREK